MSYSENPYSYYMRQGGRKFMSGDILNANTERIVFAMNVPDTPSKKPHSLEPRELRDQLEEYKQIFPAALVVPIDTPNIPFGP